MATQLPLLDSPAPWQELARHARGASYVRIESRRVLNGPESTGMGFWSINPYIGCEFGCTYCYARDTHRWAVERAGEAHQPHDALPPWLAFEKVILVKSDAPAVFSRGLVPARVIGDTILIGTATDPYQPAEKMFGITRGILERLLGYRGLTLGIITKSPLVVRDVELLARLSTLHQLKVSISLASLDRQIVRRLEARSPAPLARLRALKALTDAGIEAGLMVAPIVPGITDGRAALLALLAAGKEAGARYAYGSALRLGPAARDRFLPHLAQEFPALSDRYARRYGRSDRAGKDYESALAARFHALKEQLGYRDLGEWKHRSQPEREGSRA
ncbi:MAG: radical SAM protein [Gemmatimonadales bacterium]